MNIITLEGKTFSVKYIQSKEVITTDFSTGIYNYPDFVGSKLYHNSTSSDKYSLNFAIHKTNLVAFKQSIKKIVTSELEAVDHPTYGKLLNLVIEHPSFGAIKGNIVGSITYNTGSEADITCSCVFAEHTEESRISKLDLQDENLNAINGIDAETAANFDTDLSAQDKSVLVKAADGLNQIYDKIQNSAVISAFNDLKAELNKATLDSLRVMNSFKKIIQLPNQIKPDIRGKLDLLTSQATVIKNIPATSYNLTLFNANLLSYNMGIASQAPFVSESALQAASGIKTVPLI